MTAGQKEYAIRMAQNRLDSWRDLTNAIQRFSSYYFEAMACAETAAVIGIRVGLGLAIRFDKGGQLIDDDMGAFYAGANLDECARERAVEYFDQWINATGVLELWATSCRLAEAAIEDAALIGLRVAGGKAIRFNRHNALIRDDRKDFGSRGEAP